MFYINVLTDCFLIVAQELSNRFVISFSSVFDLPILTL